MTKEIAINRIKEIERCTPIHTEDDVKDCKALEMAIQALSQEPCDAVSRESVKEIINDIRDCISVEGYCAILERLKKLPSVTQKSGKWEDLHRCWVCSECGQQTHIEHKYCPNCGARMVEPQERSE